MRYWINKMLSFIRKELEWIREWNRRSREFSGFDLEGLEHYYRTLNIPLVRPCCCCCRVHGREEE